MGLAIERVLRTPNRTVNILLGARYAHFEGVLHGRALNFNCDVDRKQCLLWKSVLCAMSRRKRSVEN